MEHLRSLGDQRMLLLFFLFCRLPVVSAIEKLLQTVLVCGNPWSSLFLFKFLGISRLLNVGDKLWGAKVKQANCVCVFYCLKANLSEALKPIHMHELGCCGTSFRQMSTILLFWTNEWRQVVQSVGLEAHPLIESDCWTWVIWFNPFWSGNVSLTDGLQHFLRKVSEALFFEH